MLQTAAQVVVVVESHSSSRSMTLRATLDPSLLFLLQSWDQAVDVSRWKASSGHSQHQREPGHTYPS